MLHHLVFEFIYQHNAHILYVHVRVLTNAYVKCNVMCM